MGTFQLLILLYPPKAKDSPNSLWFEEILCLVWCRPYASSVGVPDVEHEGFSKRNSPIFWSEFSCGVGAVYASDRKMVVMSGSASAGWKQEGQLPVVLAGRWRDRTCDSRWVCRGGRYAAAKVAPIKKLSDHGSNAL